MKRNDLLLLIQATPNAEAGEYLFLVPKKLERQMKVAIGKRFCICLWWEAFEGFSIQPNDNSNELLYVDRAYKRNTHSMAWPTCR